jgi:hypothetical protein
MDPLAPVVARNFVAANVTYTGVFLDEASHHALLDWWKNHTDAPVLPKIWAHHMTMKFKPTAEELEATPFGEKVKLRVIGWAADEKGQAVLVEPVGVSSAPRRPVRGRSTRTSFSPRVSTGSRDRPSTAS